MVQAIIARTILMTELFVNAVKWFVRIPRCSIASVCSLLLVTGFAIPLAAQGFLRMPLNAGSTSQSPGVPVSWPEQSASLTGTVHDSRGVVIPGVQVTIVGPDNVARAVKTDDNGAFTADQLAPGSYRVHIDAAGIVPFSSAVVVGSGEQHALPIVVLRQPRSKTTVDVKATLDDVAQAQVKEEEKQRVLGILPNYYTSYIWNAAPMKPKLKFDMALRTAIDPMTFLVTAGVAGVEQAHKTFPGYGQGMEGYAKRYGASYADTVSARMFGSAIYPVLLHQDPRYFYQGSGSVRSRVLYALLSTVICRGDNGELQPNYSHILGSFTAAGISNLYRAPSDRQASLTFRNGLIVLGGGAITNLLREFVSKKVTSGVPSFANGKP